MTIPQIHKAIRPHKRVSRTTLYTYLRRFRIKPVGVRQCPQRYPADTAARILKALGITTNGNHVHQRRKLSNSR